MKLCHAYFVFALLLALPASPLVRTADAINYEFDFMPVEYRNQYSMRSRILRKTIDRMPYFEATGINKLHSSILSGTSMSVAVIDADNVYKLRAGSKRKHEALEHGRRPGPGDGMGTRGANMACIIGGKKEGCVGVAPNALVTVYDVFGGAPATSATAVSMALKYALETRHQIITLPEIKLVGEQGKQLRERIIKAGQDGAVIVVAASRRNMLGDDGYFSYAGLPVISVGGYDQPYQLAHWFEAADTGKRIGFTSTIHTRGYSFGPVEVKIIEEGYGLEKTTNRGIKKDANNDLAGKVLFIASKSVESIDFYNHNYWSAGVRGIIVTTPDTRQRRQRVLPFFVISEADAQYIRERAEQGQNEYVFDDQFGNIKSNEPVAVAKIRAPNGQLELPMFPDILAPSTHLLLTYDAEHFRYNRMSDVSAAVAYVAGVAALLIPPKSTYPDNAQMLKRILQEHALPIFNRDGRVAEPVLYQGAGMIRTAHIPASSLAAEPTLIDLGVVRDGSITRPLTIHGCTAPLQCRFSQRAAKHLLYSRNGYFQLEPNDARASVKLTWQWAAPLDPNAPVDHIAVTFTVHSNLPQHASLEFSGFIKVVQHESNDRSSPPNTMYIPYKGVISRNVQMQH
ncbi:peptidase S8/S53 domain-containing protein [Syncephalis pseudoplumigaleata]|uniref:Peptidase S8/S53 domain-containing protein n=1 Tax=Syncephalis pseudoplumigaleata TaxID=1712513 RepID=A0A4P9YV66_9FUNG|nr:peptidase S8/S53 domain-containing protein [Syncephalis pseudoplumigaleata]|eukprot:RKP23943.1 peptidase S8/S53 domain-containing protein [Syncephalis pseudoplumigaleata]